jgi:DNA-binding transcriptional LysR family regulator
MLDLRRLRVLREVSRQGSFSAAADALSYTQPAISRQIATLEKETGATLVDRNARGVRLTDAGEALVEHTEAILARLASAEAEVRAIGDLRGGRLRMAAFPTAAATIVPMAIATFKRRHPDIDLSLAMAEPADSHPLLRAGELDLAVSLEGVDADLEGLELQPLFEDPMYIALSRDHPLAARARISLADLADEPWMVGTTDRCPDSALFIRVCREAGFEPHLAFQNDDYAAVQGFVAAGVAVALIPDLGATTVREDIVLRSLGPGAPVRRVVAATKVGGYRSPAAAAMLEILAESSLEWLASRRANRVATVGPPARAPRHSRPSRSKRVAA